MVSPQVCPQSVLLRIAIPRVSLSGHSKNFPIESVPCCPGIRCRPLGDLGPVPPASSLHRHPCCTLAHNALPGGDFAASCAMNVFRAALLMFIRWSSFKSANMLSFSSCSFSAASFARYLATTCSRSSRCLAAAFSRISARTARSSLASARTQEKCPRGGFLHSWLPV